MTPGRSGPGLAAMIIRLQPSNIHRWPSGVESVKRRTILWNRAGRFAERRADRSEAIGIDSVTCKTYAYSMRETRTVSPPPRTKRLIARAATESGLTTSEYVRMAIHRKLWQDAVTESRRVAVPRARAKGVFTDEDVFALIS